MDKVTLNIKAGENITIDTGVDLNDKNCSIQCFKHEDGAQNVIKNIKEFNNTNKDNFYFNSENISFQNSMKINTTHKLESVLNGDGLYETSIIKKSNYKDIKYIL